MQKRRKYVYVVSAGVTGCYCPITTRVCSDFYVALKEARNIGITYGGRCIEWNNMDSWESERAQTLVGVSSNRHLHFSVSKKELIGKEDLAHLL